MTDLITPAALLMRRLLLLPKFAVVAMLFLLPLLLVGGLLFNELERSIDATEKARAGLRELVSLETTTHALLSYGGRNRLAASGNAAAAQRSDVMRAELESRFTQKSGAEMNALADARPTLPPAIHQAWQTLRDSGARPESYDLHTRLIQALKRHARAVADETGISMDPQPEAHHLAIAAIDTLPAIAVNLSNIAARGATYIDTGLMEANEDVVLQSAVRVARRDLERVPEQFEAAFAHAPELRPALAPKLEALQNALAFLDRAENEVLKSIEQTSGAAFLDAGEAAVAALHATASDTATAVDGLLAQRIEANTFRRNGIAAAVLGALALACYLLVGFYVSFSTEIAKLQEAVQRAASGDLCTAVSSTARDEVGQLTNAFSGMNSGLASLVHTVREGSGAVNQAAAQISADNANLSARTEAQASSLEQTASSLEEFGASVRQNSENAARAGRLVEEASRVAGEGGAVVREVVDTMGEIESSSRRIGEIVNVIDQIAFQTNLLALNAAVEAAHAGAHGRGFAVVAAEVRGLAQRSGTAAQEVKLLIEGSARQVESGSRLVNSAGATMQEIIKSVQQVAEIMREITEAGREQALGIDQINQAIGQLDDVTQSNAALVEHAAVAANALRQQADALSQAVAVFRLTNDEQADTHVDVHHVLHDGPLQPLELRGSAQVLKLPDTHAQVQRNLPVQRTVRQA